MHGPYEWEYRRHWRARFKSRRQHPQLMEPRVILSIKMTLLSIWFSHIRNFCFLIPVCNYTYFINRAINFVKICNIYANQIVTVAISTIDSDKLHRSYDALYLGITFWGHGTFTGWKQGFPSLYYYYCTTARSTQCAFGPDWPVLVVLIGPDRCSWNEDDMALWQQLRMVNENASLAQTTARSDAGSLKCSILMTDTQLT